MIVDGKSLQEWPVNVGVPQRSIFILIVFYSTLIIYGYICKTAIYVITSLLETSLNF